MTWSDGEELTAADFVFTVNTVMDLQLGGNWAQLVHSAFVDRVEAVDSHRLKIYFKATDADGNPQTPGLSVWQFGLAFMPILPEHYWAPVVEEAKKAGEMAQQIEALFAHVPDGEPTSNGLAYRQWEPGAFFENETVPSYFQMGAVVSELRTARTWRPTRGSATPRSPTVKPPATRFSSTRSARTSRPRSSASMATRIRRSSP